MRIFGAIMLSLITRSFSIFASIVFIMKYAGHIDCSWFIAILPFIVWAVLQSIVIIVCETMSAMTKKIVTEAKKVKDDMKI